MSTIDFVVRDDAGAVQRGSLADANGSSIIVTQGQDVSLNLQRGNILSYVRQGQALQVTLVDGQVLTIEGFFTPEGVANADLFISANGGLAKVDLTAGDGNLLYAQYVDGDSFGKWSPDDDLYFVRGSDVVVAGVQPADQGAEAGMLGTALLGGIGGLGLPAAGAAAAGLASAVLLTGGGGDDDDGADGGIDNGGGDGVTPVVIITEGTQSVDHVVNKEDYDNGVEVGGTGTPGGVVTVVVEDVTRETVVDEDGNWEVIYTPDEVAGGEREVEVEVTIVTDGGTDTTTDVIVLDTVTQVTFANEIVETDGTINLVEESDGFKLTGTNEAGATVVVTIDGIDYDADVTGENWSLDVDSGVIASGEYGLSVTVTATDLNNNVDQITKIVNVDTVVTVTIDTASVATDGTVNFDEESNGFTITGTADANSVVVVSLVGTTFSQEAVVTGTTWSIDVPAGTIEGGTYDLTVNATATDANNNMMTATGIIPVDTVTMVDIDTSAAGGDGTVNLAEYPDGFLVSGTAEAGATVVVTTNKGGEHTVVATDGTWTTTFTSAELPGGTYDLVVTAVSTDLAQNTATASGSIIVDTELDVTVVTNTVGGNGTINAAEHAAGATLTGQTDAFAEVTVAFGTGEYTVNADANGNWSKKFSASEIPKGQIHNEAVTVTARDAAGNVANASGIVKVDTVLDVDLDTSKVADDGIINFVERRDDGLVLSGTSDAFAQIDVTFNGVARSTSADGNGVWTATWPTSAIPAGEHPAVAVSVRAEDAAGNVKTISRSVEVDTFVNTLDFTSGQVGGDGTLNKAEAAQGLTIGGNVEVGSTSVLVNFSAGANDANGVQKAATISADGSWTVTFMPEEITQGTYNASVSVVATDRAGNTRSIADTFLVDTDPNAVPDTDEITTNGTVSGVSGFSALNIGSDVDVDQVQFDGSASTDKTVINRNDYNDGTNDVSDFKFASTDKVPNGSHLVVTDTDAADNSNSTLFVMDDTATNEVSFDLIDLTGFNIGAIDLEVAYETDLTITVDQIKDLSNNDDNLIIHGGSDDKVTVEGTATVTGDTKVIDNQTYKIVDLGDDSTLLVNDQIDFSVI